MTNHIILLQYHYYRHYCHHEIFTPGISTDWREKFKIYRKHCLPIIMNQTMLPNISTNTQTHRHKHTSKPFHSFYLFFLSIRTHSHFISACSTFVQALARSFACSLVRLIETINVKWMGSVRFSSCFCVCMFVCEYTYKCVCGCRWINTPSPHCAMVCTSIVSLSLPSMIISCVRAHLVSLFHFLFSLLLVYY